MQHFGSYLPNIELEDSWRELDCIARANQKIDLFFSVRKNLHKNTGLRLVRFY